MNNSIGAVLRHGKWATCAGLVILTLSFAIFDLHARTTASELVNSWAQNEAVSIQQGNILSAITKSQRLLFSSNFVSGIRLVGRNSFGDQNLAEFGVVPKVINSDVQDEIQISSIGIFEYAATYKIPGRSDLFVVFGITPKFVTWIFLAFSFLIIVVVSAYTYFAVRSEKSRLESKAKLADLARGVAHDIRGPLSTIRMALSKPLNGESIELLRSAAGRINGIAEELLSSGRSSERLFDSAEPQADILKIAKLVVDEKRGLLTSNADLEIVLTNRTGKASIFVACDEVNAARVLSNLIQNSIEATSHCGKIEIAIDQQKQFVSVAIADSGKGIPSQQIPRLFQEGSTFGKEAGNGLGLYQAKCLIEKWKGSIRLFSKEGVGTTVFVNLPLCVRQS